jgi:ADP-L-glycero-D-manno-heptose 6-epimerase
MTTIVTGAAGFIGRNVVATLNRQGHDDLLLVDQLGRDEKWKNLRGLQYEDLIPPGDLDGWLLGRAGVDAVIHLGACSDTTEADADFLLENNYRFSRRLCNWAVEHDVRFIYASSAATYGDGAHGYTDDDASTRRLKPLNMYGYSKHMFDLWALQNRLLNQIVGLKFFNVFGPFEEHKGEMRSVVAKAHEQILASGELSLFKSYREDVADGDQRRDFVYVDDAVAVILHFLQRQDVAGLYNCGTGVAGSWVELAEAVFKSMDRPANVRFIDMPEALRAKYQYFTRADTSRLRQAGFEADFLDLDTAVDTYVRSHLNEVAEDAR